MKKTRIACAILALSLAHTATASSTTSDSDYTPNNNDDTYLGVGIGSVIGAIIAGPPGAAVGAALGGTVGWSESQTSELSARLSESNRELKEKEISLRRQESELSKANQKVANLTRSNALQASRIANLMAQTKVNPEQEDFLQNVVEHYAQQIHFSKGEFKLPADAADRLDSLSELLKTHPNLSVNLKAYADQTGPESFNAQLAQARGDVIKDYLLKKGVNLKQLSIEAIGEAGAVIQLGDTSNYVLDRRVSIQLDVNKPEGISLVSTGEAVSNGVNIQ